MQHKWPLLLEKESIIRSNIQLQHFRSIKPLNSSPISNFFFKTKINHEKYDSEIKVYENEF